MVRKGSDGSESADGGYSRRRLLRAGGATAVGLGIAGCSGGGELTTASDEGGLGTTGGGDGENTTTTSSDEGTQEGNLADPVFNTFTNSNPTNTHYNYFNAAQYAGMNNLLYNQLWRYNWRTGKYHDRIGTNFSVDGTTATFDVDTDYAWNDGTAVTAADVEKQLLIAKYIEDPIWNYISGVSTSGEQTVELTLKQEYNSNVFRAVLGQARYIVVKRGGAYDEWLKRFQDAGTGDERATIVEEFTTWTYAKDSDDPAVNGPYQVRDHTSSKWTLERNPHFPYKTNIEQFVLTQSSSDQQTWQRMISDQLDGAGIIATPSNIQEQLPDHMKQVQLPAGGTYAPMFNFDTVWGTRAARKAFTYLMDRKLVDQNINPRHEPLQHVTGLTDTLAKEYLGDDFINNTLTNYGVESKPEKAAQTLRDAGFTKESGQWMTPDGNRLSLEWVGPSFPGATGFAQTLSQLLPQFGIKFTDTTLSAPQWISRRQEENYDLTFNYIGGGPHPYFFLSAVITSSRSQYGNWPREVAQVPPVGQPTASDQELNIAQVLQNMTVAKSDKELSDATKRYSWYLNQELPVTQLTAATWPTYVTTDDFTFPSTDADVMGLRSPFHQLLRETQDGSDRAILQSKQA